MKGARSSKWKANVERVTSLIEARWAKVRPVCPFQTASIYWLGFHVRGVSTLALYPNDHVARLHPFCLHRVLDYSYWMVSLTWTSLLHRCLKVWCMVSCIGFSPCHQVKTSSRPIALSWKCLTRLSLTFFYPQILWPQAFLVGIKPLRAHAVTAAEKGVLSQFRLWKTAALSDQGRFHRGQTWTGAGPSGSTEEWAGCDGTISTTHESWMKFPCLHFRTDRGSNLSFDCSCQTVPWPGQDRGPVSWLTLIWADNYLQATGLPLDAWRSKVWIWETLAGVATPTMARCLVLVHGTDVGLIWGQSWLSGEKKYAVL